MENLFRGFNQNSDQKRKKTQTMVKESDYHNNQQYSNQN